MDPLIELADLIAQKPVSVLLAGNQFFHVQVQHQTQGQGRRQSCRRNGGKLAAAAPSCGPAPGQQIDPRYLIQSPQSQASCDHHCRRVPVQRRRFDPGRQRHAGERIGYDGCNAEELRHRRIDAPDTGHAPGKDDPVHTIESTDRVKELQRPTDLLHQHLFEGTQNLGGIAIR